MWRTRQADEVHVRATDFPGGGGAGGRGASQPRSHLGACRRRRACTGAVAGRSSALIGTMRCE